MKLELTIAKILRVGVLISAILLAAGLLAQFKSTDFSLYQNYSEMPLKTALAQAIDQQQWGLLTSYAGLAVLILLPLLRVGLTMIVFALQRDFILAFISAIVLTGLLISVRLGF